MSEESLIEAIAGCISKNMTVQLYPREVLDAARDIAEKYVQQRIAELEKDAARYRWLRDADYNNHRELDVCDDCMNVFFGPDLDMAIDDAMDAAKKNTDDA